MKLLARMLSWFAGDVTAVSGERQRSPKWETFRREFLKVNNECAACGSVRDLEVHHVVPYQRRPDLELDSENCITLCRDDHFTFGHLKDWRSWNETVRYDCQRYKAKVRRRP